MKRLPHKQRILLLCMIVLFGAAGLSGCKNSRALYWVDTVRGWYRSGVSRVFSGNNSFAVIDQEHYRRYVSPYRDLSRSFVYCNGILLYTADKAISLKELARKSIRYTNWYRGSKLRNAIRRCNGLTAGIIRPGSVILIPGALPSLIIDQRNSTLPPPVAVRGLYFTGISTGSRNILKNLPRYKALGINSIVFDAKDVTGIVNYNSRVPDVLRYRTAEKASISNIRMMVREVKGQGIYLIARIAVFQDRLLYKRAPGLAIRSKRSGGKWRAGRGEKWVDPTSKIVQDYNISIARELARLGVDEIQFDYIRFPTGGNRNNARFRYDFGRMKREDVITGFLKRAYAVVRSENARLSIDIFGVVAWGKRVDIIGTGQRIERLAAYCDVISPMLYPSHFDNDFDGFSRPGDNPHHFIYNGCKKVMALAGKKTLIRPWLQAFKWRVSNYNEKYILEQIRGAREAGAAGYLFWSASNNYRVVLRALKEGIGEKKELALKKNISVK